MTADTPIAKNYLEEWLTEHARGTGLLAAGILHRDRTCFNQTFSDEFPSADLETAWNRLAETIQNLNLCRVTPFRTLWSFEHAQVQFVMRVDGAALGLITVAYPMPPDPAWVEGLVQDFLQL